MWLNKLKIAIIEKDMDSLTTLMQILPTFKDPKEIDEALHLIKVATQLVEGFKDEIQNSMIQMQKNIAFLKVTQAPSTGKLDITS